MYPLVLETMPAASTFSVPLPESPIFRLPPTVHGSGCVVAPPGTTLPVVITEARAGPAMVDGTIKARTHILNTVNRAISILQVDMAAVLYRRDHPHLRRLRQPLTDNLICFRRTRVSFRCPNMQRRHPLNTNIRRQYCEPFRPLGFC